MNDIRKIVDCELATMRDGDDPEVNAAIKRLTEKRKNEQPLTDVIKEQSLDFLTAKPSKLKAIITKFPEYCKNCQESGSARAISIIEAIVDRYVGQDFDIDCDTLTFIGIHLNKNGYKQEALRCWAKAENIISK